MCSLCLVCGVNDLILCPSVVVWTYIRGKSLQTFSCSFRVLWSGRVSVSSATWNSRHTGISDVPPGATRFFQTVVTCGCLHTFDVPICVLTKKHGYIFHLHQIYPLTTPQTLYLFPTAYSPADIWISTAADHYTVTAPAFMILRREEVVSSSHKMTDIQGVVLL